jgi:hypothetical protein
MQKEFAYDEFMMDEDKENTEGSFMADMADDDENDDASDDEDTDMDEEEEIEGEDEEE